jgi:nickel transport protein
VEGAAIHGRAYFPGDVPAQESEVIARDKSGRELGRTKADNEGKFTFPVGEHVDYYIIAQTPDGHGGQYIVHASEMPDKLPMKVPTTGQGSQVESQATDQADVKAGSAATGNEPDPVGTQLVELRKQIQELRRQVFESDERLRFRDILGGIGFILGLTGVAFYMKARQSGS